MLMRLLQAITFCLMLMAPVGAVAQDRGGLICLVDNKTEIFEGNKYTTEDLNRLRFGVVLDADNGTLSRCSVQSSDGEYTCDTYNIDRTEIAAGFVDIRKYYYFQGQFDLQIFDGERFIENNGRGSIATGLCIPL
jgi:hypothetical protein